MSVEAILWDEVRRVRNAGRRHDGDGSGGARGRPVRSGIGCRSKLTRWPRIGAFRALFNLKGTKLLFLVFSLS